MMHQVLLFRLKKINFWLAGMKKVSSVIWAQAKKTEIVQLSMKYLHDHLMVL